MCLRRLLDVLCERGHLHVIPEFPYIGIEDQVHEILLVKARKAELEGRSGHYYEILYALHVKLGNYRRGAKSFRLN